jgi:hypothetical protein
MALINRAIHRDGKKSKNIFLPGLGLPADYWLNERKFIDKYPLSVFDGWSSCGVTLREMRMMEFIGQVTDKPGWETKVFDEEIVDRWRKEGDVHPESLDGDVYLSEKMFDFVHD